MKKNKKFRWSFLGLLAIGILAGVFAHISGNLNIFVIALTVIETCALSVALCILLMELRKKKDY